MDNDCKQVSPYVYDDMPLLSFRFFPPSIPRSSLVNTASYRSTPDTMLFHNQHICQLLHDQDERYKKAALTGGWKILLDFFLITSW
jgi:hypothetical protein